MWILLVGSNKEFMAKSSIVFEVGSSWSFGRTQLEKSLLHYVEGRIKWSFRARAVPDPGAFVHFSSMFRKIL
jgi:hypothetical protein